MKKVIFFLLFVMLSSALANPVSPNLFSELLFTDFGWQIEVESISTWLSLWDSTAKFSIVLQSGTDTARFTYTNPADENLLVLTSEDLDTILDLEPFEDDLKVSILVNEEMFLSDEFSWGPNGVVAAPKFGQSICFGRYHHIDMPYPTYYLDNSPTIGAVNDKDGTQGKVLGYVVDPYDIPIPGVVICTPLPESETGWPFFSVLTDSLGRFEFNTISFKWQITIQKDGYYSQSPEVQIWPDSTIELKIVLQPKPEYYQSYFPLQVGNVWKYSVSYPQFTFTISIDEVVTIGDNQYYKYGERYVRYDSLGNVLCYQGGKDTILYYISKGSQDSVQISGGEYPAFLFVSFEDTLSTKAGTFSDILKHFYRFDYTIDGNYYDYFAKDIGLVKTFLVDGNPPVEYSLYYAKVNGIEYPTSGILPNPPKAEKYALKLENYPNPFNQSTTINYSLPTDGDIKLAVFDINGKCVDNLFNGKQRAGSYHFIWNGGSASSGVYLIRLRTENNVVTHKCLLVK